jgi:hypothetical protein
MATEDRHVDDRGAGYHPWVGGAVAGVAAGVAMGVLLSVGTPLMVLIGALYGIDSFFGGWLAHLVNSVFFALLFAFAMSRAIVRRETLLLSTYAAIGIMYGAFLAIITGGILFPLWVNAGIQIGLPLPFLPYPGDGEFFVEALVLGLAHLVYGGILGPVYALASRSVVFGPERV